MALDPRLLQLLPRLTSRLSSTSRAEVGLNVTFHNKNYGDKWFVNSSQLDPHAVICVRVHPHNLIPPTTENLREILNYYNTYGNNAPDYYVLDKSGLWRILKSANEALTTDKRKITAMLAYMLGASDNRLELLSGKIDTPEYLKKMKCWGINIDFIPSERFIRKGNCTLLYS
jgi:hypothetical protein